MSEKKHLLWIDDDIYFIRPYVEKFEDEGFTVLHARDATSGMLLFEDPDVDINCVIIDMAMDPGWGFSQFETKGGHYSGVSLARCIYSHDNNIPLIAFSHYLESKPKKWFIDKNFPYLIKNDTSEHHLVNVMKRCLDPNYVMPIKIFIVHGHDRETLLDLKNYIQNTLKIGEPIILDEKPSFSNTIIEKFEYYSDDVTVVFIIMTKDDKVTNDREFWRARQNVIFEAGYFVGKIGRTEGRIIILHADGVEMPSDLHGVIYIDISNGISASGENIRKELAKWI